MLQTIIILAFALIVAVRFIVPTHGHSWGSLYEALTHIAVGIVIAVAYFRPEVRWLTIGLIIGATTLEVVLFVKG